MCIYLGLFFILRLKIFEIVGYYFWFWSSWTRWLCFRFGSRWLHRWFLCLGWLICISSFLCSSCVIVTWLMLWCFSWSIRTRRLTWLSIFSWFICFFLRCFFLSRCVFFSWVGAFSFCWVLWIWFVLGCFVDVSLEDCCVCAVLPWLVGCTFIELFCSLE